MYRAIVFLILLHCGCSVSASNFPRPASLEPAVQFWTRVYTEISTSQGFLHDATTLSVVYETLQLPESGSRVMRERQLTAARKRIRSALEILGTGKRSELNTTEQAVLAAWPANTPNSTLANAARQVRFQRGQSNRFKAGLIRSGQWKPHIQDVLAERGLPPELDVLPHVESSFNPDAYSKVAAAGMWQFMPATARLYMRVDHVVDERMDPFIASVGAARLLENNYRVTGSWPLALTAYNHGTGGILRAARTVGTVDIGVIVQQYSSRTFGFASRNFYASFLAALEVDRNPERYFGKVELAAPIPYAVISLPQYTSAAPLARAMGTSLEALRRHNPALRETVWSGEKYIPRNFDLRVPAAELAQPLEQTVAALSPLALSKHQKPDVIHRIETGDSLSAIAYQYGTSVSKLMALNSLNSHRIRAGKALILPGTIPLEPHPDNALADTRPAVGPGEYIIRRGDSLWSIAQQFKISVRQLQAWNALSGKKYLQPGQKLKIAATG